MRILSCDPGKTNFAYAVLDGTQILKVGKLKTPIHDLNDEEQQNAYRRQIGMLLGVYKPEAVIAERFQNRGRFSGDQGECVSLMLGILLEKARNIGVKTIEFVGPMIWKCYFRRFYVTEKIAKSVLKEEYARIARSKSKKKKRKRKLRYHFEMEHLIESETLSEHEIDAIGIALFKIETTENKTGLLWKIRSPK